MSNAAALTSATELTESQRFELIAAGNKIAPSWPLDQMIAVNPFWTMRDEHIEQVASKLSALGNAHLLMPIEYYQSLYAAGDITPEALVKAAKEKGTALPLAQLEAYLSKETETVHWHNLSDLLDSQRDQHKMTWCDEIIHQISQFCAAHYQQLRPVLRCQTASHQPGLYQHWLDVIRHDRGISIVMDEPGLNKYFKELPDDVDALFAEAIVTLGINDSELEPYSHALLLDINGWASWVAYLRWQGELNNQPHDDMLSLLAIRMAWELVIWRYLEAEQPMTFSPLKLQWQREKRRLPILLAEHNLQQHPLWIWAKAAELSYQQQLNNQLLNARQQVVETPELQAIFCIDVRSEVMRRALEAQSDKIQTLGFAGFFGLPLEYQPQSSPFSRPQLPGLLKARIQVSEKDDNSQISDSTNLKVSLQNWSKAAPSTFSMVESMGWVYAFKMLKQSFFSKGYEHPINKLTHSPHWEMKSNGQALTIEDKAELTQGILNAMGLQAFAPTVLLVGHGSHTNNNLHSAGLDCGACGGQSGEVNVRVLAQLLNDQDVRRSLHSRGIDIPETTRFIAALHNTTTDNIDCFGEPASNKVKQWLSAAKDIAQRERIALIDPTLQEANQESINKAFQKRSRDWSQVRPEWGLANNAAFIVAPRSRTRNVNLKGRSFLHDYNWETDNGFKVLEQIMTAPMVVTNWINMQYNASVTDNFKYGSGNKALHNAVGGNIGVFEGNGGDLRTGLSMQSLHNGEHWMHQPQRLAVYIAAPREPIGEIVIRHDHVRHLIDNEWLFLMGWDENGLIERFYRGQWVS